MDNKIRASRKLAIAKKKIRILPTSQPQEPKPRALISEAFLSRPFLPPVPDYSRLSATAPPDQKQRSHTAEKKDTCHNYNKTGHWANECPEVPRHCIYKINKLYPQVIEVDTDNKEIREAL